MTLEIARRWIGGRWRTGAVAENGNGGSLPQGWTATEHDPPDGEQDLDTGGNAVTGGALKRPDGTVAVAFDGEGKLEFYYADGEHVAFAIYAGGDSGGIEFFHGSAPGESDTSLKWNDDTQTWVFQDNVEYQGNDPLLITSGGLDMGEYKAENAGDATNPRDLVNLRTLLAIGFTLPTVDPADGGSLWNDNGTVKVASAP